EDLLECRLNRFRAVADRRVIRRNITPAQQPLSRACDSRFDHFLRPALGVGIARQANHSHAVIARDGQVETQFLALSLQEFVRYLEQDSSSITGIDLAAFSAAML